jgi:ribonuclease E
MANKMLIDATHPEETRVVVLHGNRVEEFDFESANRRQLRGNIYLAKVTRVEPSLQAAFVDYGGNRHGFLAFSEIHPDYYQIPVADRQALIDEEERAHRDAEAEADRRAGMRRRPRHRAAGRPAESIASEPADADTADFNADMATDLAADLAADIAPDAVTDVDADTGADLAAGHDPHGAQPAAPDAPFDRATHAQVSDRVSDQESDEGADHEHGLEAAPASREAAAPHAPVENASAEAAERRADDAAMLADDEAPRLADDAGAEETEGLDAGERTRRGEDDGNGEAAAEGEEEEIVESVGGADAMEEVPDRAPRYRRQYKIQEVIKRRQIMLVQVVKEERGTKGAALTTYLSLAGRYSVLMPNTARGGGISRKITNVQDRKRLKEIAQELEVPEGMGVILRTAGAARTKTEIKRDFEYLLRAWETVRDLTLKSTAPTLVYEEGSLVKRSIRDLYNKDIDEVIVAGNEAYRDARDFMGMLMPSHAKNVKPYRETQPLLARYGIESQLDAMFSPVVQLRSGGYIVLNQAEALVAIDVNSGRATREHHIEDTALKTNLEAAEEIARQLRLRDLAGLIVIDFIDMDEKRNNRSVERRLKDCLKNDRARIQVGRISHFGLLEMSRQRIRASVLESSTDKCPHCGGTGHVRSVASVALQCLRMIEEQLQRGATHNVILRTRSEIALYVLNQKRSHLHDLEQRFKIAITVNVDPAINGQLPFMIEKGEQVHSLEQARALAAQPSVIPMIEHAEPEEPIEEEEDAETSTGAESEEDEETFDGENETEQASGSERGESDHGEDGDPAKRRRRRRRRGRRGDREGGFAHDATSGHDRGHERGYRGRGQASSAAQSPAHESGQEFAQEFGGASGEESGAGAGAEAGGDDWQPQGAAEGAAHGAAHVAAHVAADAEGGEDGEPGADNGHDPAHADGNGGDARRRRRRGRRGGRRSRRDEGDAPVRSFEYDTPPLEDEVVHAVADLGGSPPEVIGTPDTHRETDAHESARGDFSRGDNGRNEAGRGEPPPRSEPAPVSEPPKPEPRRRRSTVREPVHLAIGVNAPAPAGVAPGAVAEEPPPSSTPADTAPDSNAPRRAGWWAKRIFGEKQ